MFSVYTQDSSPSLSLFFETVALLFLLSQKNAIFCIPRQSFACGPLKICPFLVLMDKKPDCDKCLSKTNKPRLWEDVCEAVRRPGALRFLSLKHYSLCIF